MKEVGREKEGGENEGGREGGRDVRKRERRREGGRGKERGDEIDCNALKQHYRCQLWVCKYPSSPKGTIFNQTQHP